MNFTLICDRSNVSERAFKYLESKLQNNKAHQVTDDFHPDFIGQLDCKLHSLARFQTSESHSQHSPPLQEFKVSIEERKQKCDSV